MEQHGRGLVNEGSGWEVLVLCKTNQKLIKNEKWLLKGETQTTLQPAPMHILNIRIQYFPVVVSPGSHKRRDYKGILSERLKKRD